MSKRPHTLTPEAADWLAETFARNRARFAGWRMETEPSGEPGEPSEPKEPEQTFTQADVDRIVRERVKREREKFADYDELKAKAGEAQTAEERIAALEWEVASSRLEALRRRVQAAHGIADEDAELFLTGQDEDTLTAQAKRLTERESQRRERGNHVPHEGHTPHQTGDDPMREFTRSLFGAGE